MVKIHKSDFERKIKLLLSFILFINVLVYAQEVNWSTSYPKITTPEPITVLGDNASFDIMFTPLNGDISTASIEVQLPAQLKYISNSNIGTGASAGITYTVSTSGSITTGQTVKITITSDGNKLIENRLVALRLNVNAQCGASNVTNPIFVTSVYSGSTLVTGSQTNYQTSVQVPTITLTSSNPNIPYSSQTEIKTFSTSLASSDGEASSVKVIFKTGVNATLDNFKMDGVPLTYSLTSTSTEKTYTLTLTSTELGGKLRAIAREITFDASSTRCGPNDNTIYTSTQYPAESNCVTYTGVTLTMVYPDVPGLPFMEHVSTQYVDDADAIINITDVNIDGITPTKAKSVYQNTGSADAYDIVMTARCYGKYAYIDTANMYYQVEGQTTKIKIPAGSVRINSRLGAGSQLTGYYPASVQSKPFSITISIDDVVPVGSTISVWFPTISGSIFDNGNNNVYWDYGTYEFLGISTNVTGVKNRCSADGPTNSTSIRLYYVGCPHFRQLPIQQIYKSESSYTESIFVSTSLAKPETTIEVFLKLPSWLNLDGSEPITWTYDKNSGTKRPPLSSITDHGGGVYSIRYEGFSRADSYLNFNFKADPCGASVNLTDTIAYWFNHEFPNGKLEHVSQVFQPVAFECLLEGVTLDDFNPTRTTKGLRDSDNNSIPDNGTIAPDDEIRHDIYMQADEGFLTWEGTIVGNDHYKYLYVPLTSVGFTYSELSSANLTMTGNYTIDVIRGGSTNTYPVDFTNVDNNNGYFRYSAGSNSLENGDIVKVRAPFRISKGADNYTSFETEFFVSVNPISDPMNSSSDPNRFGKDRASTQLGSYTTDYRQLWNTGSSETFSNNTLQAIRTGYFDIFHSGKIVAPYFENEVRRHLYPYKIIMDIPEGYLVENPLTLENTRQLDNHNKIPLNINKAAESTTSNIVYNTYELFDLTYDGTGTVDPSKWMLPDDIWNYTPTTRVRATRGAKLGNSNMKRTVILKNPVTGEEISNSIDVTFTYTGIATTLNVSTEEITAYGPTVIIPSVAVGNPSTINIKDIWVYVKGNVENLIFKDHDTNITSNGVGVEGRWFKVSGDFAPGASSQYEMSFTYKGNNDCSGDTMYIYTAAGFESGWTPNITQEFDVTDYDHLGAYRRIIILSSPAKISGSVNTSTSVLNEGVPYTLSASISTASSPGALKDPEMILTLPAGQQYVPGTAVIEYPVGTQTPVPSSVEAALIATNGSLSSNRTFTFSLKDMLEANEVLMAGYLAPNVTNDEMYATLKADFVPTCETNLSGTRYSGVLYGTTSCGKTAEDSGTTALGAIIYPSVTSNYQFSAGINTKSGNRAFNEIRTTDSLIIIINKIVGNVDNMSASDSLEIVLPGSVNINGPVTYAGDNSMSSASGTAVVGSNIISGTTRSIYISLPITDYNNASNKGVGANVTYTIPIAYTPNGQTMAATPVQTINTAVIARAKFGSCPETSASIGSASRDIAIVTTNTNPYIAMQGEAENVIITSNGFTGSWYNDTIAGSLIITNPIYAFTPADMDTLYYSVSSVFGGVDYGRVPVWIYIYPSLEFTITDQTLCSGDSIELMTTLSAYKDSVFFKFYRDQLLTDQIPEDSLKVGPTVTTEYYVQSYNRGGFTSAPGKITLTVLPEIYLNQSLTTVSTSGKSITFNIGIVNNSDMPIGPSIPIVLYQNSATAANVMVTGQYTGQISANTTVYATVSIPDITIFKPLHILVRINDDGTTFPYEPECDITNNEMKILNPLLHLFMEKEAAINSIQENGTYSNPVSVLFGEDIEYKITAVNANVGNGIMIIRDTLPAYLHYVNGSASTGVIHTSDGTPLRDILTWNINAASMETHTITYKATPESGSCASQPMFINRAWITSSDTLHVPTNNTFHQGAGIGIVTFSASKGGDIIHSGPQAVDYQTSPRKGVIATADEGYTFSGWSHDEYISLRGQKIPAREGIMHYDTLTIYGNVELTACFKTEEYPINYYLNGSENSSSNPVFYTVEHTGITLGVPVKQGDTFTGWTGSNGDEPQIDVSIPAGITGGLTYYANFVHSGKEDEIKENETTCQNSTIWTTGGKLHIKINKEKDCVIEVYTLSGVLLVQKKIQKDSITVIPLERGFYIVTINNNPGKKIRIE